ncbi:alkyl hydroperoxide reductase subunit AhpC [Mariniflexile fucanivorans]|uniref:Alkyl hydroperoxide reductase subunit AhpC n=1 Tax=Mariniflexile fucanivorans TaxID=264023 RepID=A0A4R1RA96_9FLAO|nr:peroxiredoxin [Mariniflexile fucanivorans]TCL62628.1 alkyl hydroperoxide reductase subunit AhpC [Mariniflexile fucanivorans]
MSLRIGDDAPNFTAQTTLGVIDFHQWLGDTWGIIYSHPADFTPVCTTELGRTAQLKDEFSKRDTKVVAVSTDDLEAHKGWINDINETQNTKVEFPIIADTDKNVATLYNMIHPNFSTTATVRSVYFINPAKKIQAIITYPASTGRNFTEILRVLDSLQLTAGHSVATPVDWEVGQDVIISPSVKQEDVEVKFPKGHRVIKPYLRYTPQPNK